RLSKRHGATSVMEYERRGYPPEAMVNFLALLGWSPGGDRELFAARDLVDAFDLGGISGGNAGFNPEKLDWFSQPYLMEPAPEQLAGRVRPWLEREGLWDDAYAGDRHAWFAAVLELLRPRARTLAEFPSLGRVFFADAVDYDEAAVAKHLRASGMDAHLHAVE